MFTRFMKRRGQQVLEYAVILAIVSTAVIAMSRYVQQAVQGGIYKIEDRVIGKENMTDSVPAAPCGGPGQLACP